MRTQAPARSASRALLALCLTLSTACARAQSAWDGTWVFDSARSHLKPGRLTIERHDDGYQWGGSSGYAATCNGASQPGPDGFAITCARTAPQEIRTTLLEHSRPFSTTTYKLTDAGRSLQVTTEYAHGRRPHTIQVDSYVRASGTGTDFAGVWQGTRTELRGPLTYVLRLHDGAFYYLDTMEGAVSTAKLDGSPALFQDRHPDNVRWMNRWDGPRRIFGAYLLDGKPHLQEILELSPDGRTLKNWVVGEEDDIYVLTKQ